MKIRLRLAVNNFFWLIPPILGLGAYPLVIPTLIGILACAKKSFFSGAFSALSAPGFLSIFTTYIFFLGCYWSFYIPYHPDVLQMPWGYFPILTALSIITLLWFSCLDNNARPLQFIWLFCLGSLVFCLATIGTSVILLNPPYYANAIDIRYLPFGLIKHLNTPGIANLLCLFPMAFIAGTILHPDQRPKHFWILGFTGLALSIIAAAVIGQRSFFVVTLIIEPIIAGFFLLLVRAWRSFLAIASLLAAYPLLRRLDQFLGTEFLHRAVGPSLLNDARFQMFHFWVEKVIKNPFERIEVGPVQWSDLQWFHNFFADAHRLSGFWALLAAIILMIYIFYRIICVIRIDRRVGLFLMAIAIPCFLIMNTSVVPEGERQPFLLMLAIGAISEVLISRAKSGNKLNYLNSA